MRTIDQWKETLRTKLREAMRAKQSHVVSLLRETLAAIDNAEAAEVSAAPAVQAGVIAGGVAGLGAGEVSRRVLSSEQVRGIVEKELQERREAAMTYSRLGQDDQAATLSLQVELLTTLLGPTPMG